MKTLKAEEEFAVGKNGIAWIGDNFKKHFYGMTFTKKERPLYTKKLDKPMNDKEIIVAFGNRETTLGDVLHALHTLDKSSWYIFHVRDEKGVLWPLRGRGNGDGWRVGGGKFNVEALSSSDPGGWYAGDEFVSRDPFDTQVPASDPLILESLDARLKKLEAIINPKLLV